jgi:hypothetical protein
VLSTPHPLAGEPSRHAAGWVATPPFDDSDADGSCDIADLRLGGDATGDADATATIPNSC